MIISSSQSVNTGTNNTIGLSPIYTSNRECGVTEWLSDIKEPFGHRLAHSWHEHREIYNPNPVPTPMKTITHPIIPPESYAQQLKQIRLTGSNKEPGFIYAKKIRLYPTDLQKFILDRWFAACAKIFNITVNHVQSKIFEDGQLKDFNIIKKILNARRIRLDLKEDKCRVQEKISKEIQARQQKINKKQGIRGKIIKGIIPMHVLDESIAQAVSNFKTCMSNLKAGHIKKFKIKPQKASRRSKILKLEPQFFNGVSFCPRTFPKIKSSESLEGIEKTCTLQYSHITKKYILIVPTILEETTREAKQLSAGIDLGVTPFISVYSQNKSYSICDMNNANINRHVNRNQKKVTRINELISMKRMTNNMTALLEKQKVKNNRAVKNEILNLKNSLDAKKKITGIKNVVNIDINKLMKAKEKYNMRKQNQIKDMHYKTSYVLTHDFDKIYVGKFCIRNLLSRENVTVGPKTKEMMKILSPYSFRQRLRYMGYKYGTSVKEVSEFLTTKTCSNCGRIKRMGGLKTYKCECGMKANRDENSAKTHLKLGIMLERARQ